MDLILPIWIFCYLKLFCKSKRVFDELSEIASWTLNNGKFKLPELPRWWTIVWVGNLIEDRTKIRRPSVINPPLSFLWKPTFFQPYGRLYSTLSSFAVVGKISVSIETLFWFFPLMPKMLSGLMFVSEFALGDWFCSWKKKSWVSNLRC